MSTVKSIFIVFLLSRRLMNLSLFKKSFSFSIISIKSSILNLLEEADNPIAPIAGILKYPLAGCKAGFILSLAGTLSMK